MAWPAEELPQEEPARALAEIDLAVAAGFCAATGGRARAAAAYYLRARRAFNRSGMTAADLGPYLADQLLRSQAGHEIRRARFSSRATVRDRCLRRAERYLDVLEPLDLALPTRPLVSLERARLALARGDRTAAADLVGRARARIDQHQAPAKARARLRHLPARVSAARSGRATGSPRRGRSR